ncbi:anthranilate synthase component I [candidate division NPL-UPA2 bacterium]|nr:anthranilate synthase component I [candidate division NPL-UPA2 bacterium]
MDFYPDRKEFRRLAKKGNLIPVYREILADMETPVSAFRKIADEGYSYLLESVEGGEKLGRYSFLGSAPELIFESKGRKVEIRQGRKKKTLAIEGDDPLQALKEVMSRYRPVILKGLPRFPGGAVGYIGYDMVRFFEKLPPKNIDDLSLPDCIFIFSSCLVIFDHINHTIKVVSHAFIENSAAASSRQVDGAYKLAVEKIDKIIHKLRKPIKATLRPRHRKDSGSPLKSNFTRPDFIKRVKKAKDYIRAGDVIQVVLSQRWKQKIKADPLDLYRALRSVNPSPYMYFLKFGDLKIIGSSPEILVRAEKGEVTLRPIAGTRPRGGDEKEDETLSRELLADPKERAEHIMLVDLGRNDLGRVCHYGSVQVNEFMAIEKYSHVMHIVSNVMGKLRRGKNQFDVLRACFPAGTVTGAPKVRAMEIIEELEPTARGPYAGAVGYFSFSGNLDSCITIRTIIVKGDTAYIQAGAGIVADSRPEKEYEETKNKARALLKAMEMAERGLD